MISTSSSYRSSCYRGSVTIDMTKGSYVRVRAGWLLSLYLWENVGNVFVVDRCNETTIPTVTVTILRNYKNIVIGNPVVEVQLVRDEPFVTTWAFHSSSSYICSAHPWVVNSLIDCLNPADSASSPSSKESQDALRIEAAHVIAFLS